MTSKSSESNEMNHQTMISSPTTVILTPPSSPPSQPSSSSLPIVSKPSNNNNHECKKEVISLNNFQLTPSSYHLNLDSFIQLLPDTIRNTQCSKVDAKNKSRCHDHDPIANLFRRLTISKKEIEPFTFIDKNKNYTRNLIATDNETFTLLLLCWNPGKYSPIHDHPCDGCWMRVCQGCVNEIRYVPKQKSSSSSSDFVFREDEYNSEDGICQSSSFECVMDTIFEEGQQTFIDDHIGYHKIGNPGSNVAISMHLYSPPFKKCKIWMNPNDYSSPSVSLMCNFSEYGTKLPL